MQQNQYAPAPLSVLGLSLADITDNKIDIYERLNCILDWYYGVADNTKIHSNYKCNFKSSKLNLIYNKNNIYDKSYFDKTQIYKSIKILDIENNDELQLYIDFNYLKYDEFNEYNNYTNKFLLYDIKYASDDNHIEFEQYRLESFNYIKLTTSNRASSVNKIVNNYEYNDIRNCVDNKLLTDEKINGTDEYHLIVPYSYVVSSHYINYLNNKNVKYVLYDLNTPMYYDYINTFNSVDTLDFIKCAIPEEHIPKCKDYNQTTIFDIPVPNYVELFEIIIDVNEEILKKIYDIYDYRKNNKTYPNFPFTNQNISTSIECYEKYCNDIKNIDNMKRNLSVKSRNIYHVINIIKQNIQKEIDNCNNSKVINISDVKIFNDQIRYMKYLYDNVEDNIENIQIITSIKEDIITDLPNLKYINLKNLLFMKSTGVTKLPDNVEVLCINTTSLEELPNISETSKLIHLDVGFNNLSELPICLTNAPNLQTLNCYANRIVDISLIEHMNKLINLDCSFNIINGTFNINSNNIYNYKYIDISNNNIKYISRDAINTIFNIIKNIRNSTINKNIITIGNVKYDIGLMFNIIENTIFSKLNNINCIENCKDFILNYQ